MSNNAGARIRLVGRVQMVGFRWFARRWAEDFDLSGWVRNNLDGTVEVEVEGKRSRIDVLLEELKKGPKHAIVEDVKVTWFPFENKFRTFEIKY